MFYLLLSADLFMIATFLLKLTHLPPQIPLFYSRSANGEDQLGDLWMIAILPILLHFFIFLNVYITRKLFPNNQFIKKVVEYLNGSLIIIVTIITVKILFLIA